MIDEDFAVLYGVELKRLNEQVRRNKERFPEHFCFQLTAEEAKSLRSHFATLESGCGKHRKYLPYVFTEQGVAMLSAVLRSETAVKVSVRIMNAFVTIMQIVLNNTCFASAGISRACAPRPVIFQARLLRQALCADINRTIDINLIRGAKVKIKLV
jgi:hypothetical protein